MINIHTPPPFHSRCIYLLAVMCLTYRLDSNSLLKDFFYVLIGEPAYYSRFGFNHSPRLTASGIPAEYFMINSWCESIPSGDVGFDPAFG